MPSIKFTHITSAFLAGLMIASGALLASCKKEEGNSSIKPLDPNARITTSETDKNTSETPKTSVFPSDTTDVLVTVDPVGTTKPVPQTSSPPTDPVTEPPITTQTPNTTETSAIPTTIRPTTEQSDPVTTPAPETAPVPTTTPARDTSEPVTTTTTAPVTTTTPATAKPTQPTTTPRPTPTTTTAKPVTDPPPVTTAPPTKEDDPPEVDHHASGELVRVKDFIPDLYVDLRYAGSNNDAGYAIYSYSDAYLRYGTVKKLAKVQSELEKQGLSLLIWDAFRPLDAQYALSVALPDKATSPVSGKVAFNYGGTLSLAIVKSDGTAVALPSDFDVEGKKSDRDFSDVSAEAAKYGKLLDDLMLESGFKRYLDKWYRYTDTDSYSLITTTTLNKNGSTACQQWVVTSSGKVNMRSGPSTSYSILKSLSSGTKVTVSFFHEKFAFVTYGGMTGYISAGYLCLPDGQSYDADLSVVKVVKNYSYDQMRKDLTELSSRYPDLLSVSSIGKSEEGRDLTLAILGNPDAKNQIFVSAGIHAREHMNAELVMAQIDYMLKSLDSPFGGGKTVREILADTCFRILPMSNPDGINIVQTGVIPDAFKKQYGSSVASLWKANAKGVDLNANFDADWGRYGGSTAATSPGYMGYKGTAPECAAESKAIAEYVRSIDFDLVLSYHCMGSVIYWQYGSNTAVNNKNYDLALRLAMTNGYSLGSPGSNSTAGLKDYAVDKLGIPALTIEFGTTECPLSLQEFSNLWVRCKDTLLTSAIWVDEQ